MGQRPEFVSLPTPMIIRCPNTILVLFKGEHPPRKKKSSNPSIKIFLNVVRVEFKLETKKNRYTFLAKHFPWWRCFVKVWITLTQKRRDLYLLYFSFGLTVRDYFKEIFPSKEREKKPSVDGDLLSKKYLNG